MLRSPLYSEREVLRMFLGDSSTCAFDELQVVVEHCSRPRTSGRQWFNTDFMLQFVDPLPARRRVESVSIRQRSMGADLFCVIDEYQKPASLELLAGEAFPKSYYKEEISVVEEAIRSIGIAEWPKGICSATLLRIFDLESCVIFLASNTTDISSFAFTAATKYVADNSEIHTRETADDGCLIEGVISSSRKKDNDGWVLCST